MNKKTVAIVAASVMTLAMATSGAAQPFGYSNPYGGQPGYGYQGGPGFAPQPQFVDPGEMLEERFEWMQDRLDIQADQQDAWKAFTGTVLAQMDAHKAMRKSFRKARPKDPLEMDQRRIAMISQRLVGIKGIAKARAALFEVLTEDQREEAADLMMGHRGDKRRSDNFRGAPGWYWGY
jgi:hypothetical protein